MDFIAQIKISFRDLSKSCLAAWACFCDFCNSLFGMMKLAFKNKCFIFLLFFQCLCLCFSVLGFMGNDYNQLWGCALLNSDYLVDNNYSSLVVESASFSGKENTFDEWENLGQTLNHDLRGHVFSFIFPSSNGAPKDFEMSFGDQNFSTKIATFYNYNNEEVNLDTYAAVKLLRYDNSLEGKNFSSYPFQGKNGSSYISSRLADVLIACDPLDSYSSYGDLLGAKYSIFVGGESFFFSINNIYMADSYAEPRLFDALMDPIILDFSTIYETSQCTFYCCFDSDSQSFYHGMRLIGKASVDKKGMAAEYVSKAGRFRCPFSDNVQSLAENLGDGANLLLGGDNVIFVVFFLLSFLFCIFFLSILIKRGRLFDPSVYFVFTFLMIFLFSLLSFSMQKIIGNNLLFYSVNNVFFAISGCFLPLLFCLLFCALSRRVKGAKRS